ncbi:Protein ULTRAPETALA 1 [Glycine soja]|uniref:Protein ULTRAPETALA 1 n=1 Tax=Glycine soja TaxID=3848 RepID=A0A0B2QE29_GLYSO|nr:Protein ULTRAPETALA 1 [Glycine soja]
MTAGDPPQQKTSQGNEKKKEDENITQGDPPQQERSLRIEIEEELKNITEGPSKRRKQFRVGDDGKILFDEEELKMILDFKRGEDYIEDHWEDEDRVPLWKTPLIKYYTPDKCEANRKDSAMRKQNFHRDEFLRCTRCGKERRFHLKSRPDIKNYHDALNNKCWTLSLWPYQKITCDDYEVDKLVYKEQEVSLIVKLGHLEEGKALYWALLSMNPDNYR